MPVISYIGLGSNLGDKEANIKKALGQLERTPGIELRRVASLYRTAPVGYTSQDWFINTVAEIATTLSPHQLLAAFQDIEDRMGRVRAARWWPRQIDLDILLYGRQEINAPDLIVPHPLMAQRAFVMTPLAELAPGLVLPGPGCLRAGVLAGKLAREQEIKQFAGSPVLDWSRA